MALATGIRTSRRLTALVNAVTAHVVQTSLQCDAGVAVVWCSPSHFARNRAQTRSWSSPILESCAPRHGIASCGRGKMRFHRRIHSLGGAARGDDTFIATSRIEVLKREAVQVVNAQPDGRSACPRSKEARKKVWSNGNLTCPQM